MGKELKREEKKYKKSSGELQQFVARIGYSYNRVFCPPPLPHEDLFMMTSYEDRTGERVRDAK